MGEVNLGTVYEMNKQLSLKTDKVLDPIAFNIKVKEIAKDVISKGYWMLLSNERKDFTIFHMTSYDVEKLYEELSETLKNIGSLVTAHKNADGAWEIWIRDTNPLTSELEDYVYYFFDYNNAIIEV